MDFLSRSEWSVIGLAIAIVFGMVCRSVIGNRTRMGLLAAAALVGGAVWAELYFSVPLSHDTIESSSWSAYLLSALSSTWSYGLVEMLAIISGWHFDTHRFWHHRFRKVRGESA
jgi:hypothetical protein